MYKCYAIVSDIMLVFICLTSSKDNGARVDKFKICPFTIYRFMLEKEADRITYNHKYTWPSKISSRGREKSMLCFNILLYNQLFVIDFYA